MKIRSGFVSNSSTSSYIILVKPEKVEAVDFILRHSSDIKPSKSVPERKEELKEEIKELRKDVTYVSKLKAELKELTGEREFKFHELCEDIDSMCRINSLDLFGIRNQRLYVHGFERDTNQYLARLKDAITKLNGKEDKCKRELKQLSGNEDWRIVSFEEDAGWGHLKHMVRELVDNGDAVVLFEETS